MRGLAQSISTVGLLVHHWPLVHGTKVSGVVRFGATGHVCSLSVVRVKRRFCLATRPFSRNSQRCWMAPNLMSFVGQIAMHAGIGKQFLPASIKLKLVDLCLLGRRRRHCRLDQWRNIGDPFSRYHAPASVRRAGRLKPPPAHWHPAID